MKIYALIGESGTGKSYNSIKVAASCGADYIIDDGLLIYKNKIIEGTSAKREATLIAAIKKAIFQDDKNCLAMKEAIRKNEPKGILILGTSQKMVEKIRTRLELPELTKTFSIEEVATKKDIEKARLSRQSQGKHIIPVPVMEIRKTFSGYFLDPLQVFRKNHLTNDDKSIVRPTYSYLGEFVINDTVLYTLASYETQKCSGVDKVLRISLEKSEDSIIFNLDISAYYGLNIPALSREITENIKNSVEKYASIYIDGVNITVRSLTRQ